MKIFFLLKIMLLLSCWSQLATSEPEKNTLILAHHIQGNISSTVKNNIEITLIAARGTNPLSAKDSISFYQSAPPLIEKAMQPFGYFRPHIQSRLVKHKGQWEAYFIIEAGPPLPMINIDIQLVGAGKDKTIFNCLLNDLALKVGQPFTTDTYQNMKQALFATANHHGYAKASFVKQEVKIDLLNYTAEIILQLDTGSRYYFGAMDIAPNFFADLFLKGFARFDPGNVYSSQKLLGFQQNLIDSGYFQYVSVTSKLNAEQNNQIPIEVKVTPTKKFLYNASAGYGTDTGIRGNVGFEWRHITAMGQYFTSNLSTSQLNTTFTNNYFIPGSDPITDRYNLNASLARLKSKAGKSNIQNYAGSLTTTQGRWRKIYSLAFAREVYQLKAKLPACSHLLIPSINLHYVATDDIVRPTHSLTFEAKVSGATRYAFSATDFLQLTTQTIWMQPISYYQRCIVKVKAGAIISKSFNDLPLSLHFTAGGAQSVRAYSYQQLGPGRYLFTASGEFQQRVYKDFFVGLFYDTGNAFMVFKEPKLKTGVGPAFIWNSPLGNIELSFAKSLSLPGRPWAVHVSVGVLL